MANKRKKSRAKFYPIKVQSTKEIRKFSYKKSLMELNKAVKEIVNNQVLDFQEFQDSINNNLHKKVQNATSEILKKEYTSKTALLRDLKKVIKKTVNKSALTVSVNDAYKQLNEAELSAAQSAAGASNIRKVKYWVTRFDRKTRSWHDAVNHQHKKINELFVVQFPNGTDYLKGPKIPPISFENFVNCRCTMQFSVVK